MSFCSDDASLLPKGEVRHSNPRSTSAAKRRKELLDRTAPGKRKHLRVKRATNQKAFLRCHRSSMSCHVMSCLSSRKSPSPAPTASFTFRNPTPRPPSLSQPCTAPSFQRSPSCVEVTTISPIGNQRRLTCRARLTTGGNPEVDIERDAPVPVHSTIADRT